MGIDRQSILTEITCRGVGLWNVWRPHTPLPGESMAWEVIEVIDEDVALGLLALREPVVATWESVKTRLKL